MRPAQNQAWAAGTHRRLVLLPSEATCWTAGAPLGNQDAVLQDGWFPCHSIEEG